MGAEANGEGTQTVEATAGSEAADTTQAVGADEAAGAQHTQVPRVVINDCLEG